MNDDALRGGWWLGLLSLAAIVVPTFVGWQTPDLDALRDAARARMRQVGMDDALIAQVVREGRVRARVILTAPTSGVSN